MGISISANILLGMQVDLDQLYQTVEVSNSWCDHEKSEGAIYCPVCGSRKPKTRFYLELRPFVVNEDHLYNGFKMKHCNLYLDGSQSSGTKILIAGLQLFYLDTYGATEGHRHRDLPQLTEAQVIESLAEHGLAPMPGTFGLHQVITAG